MGSIIKPAALKPGDTVAVVAPASNLKADYLARGLAELQRLGFRVRVREEILDKHRYTAGSDQRRVVELMRAFADPEVKAIFAARGGYGAMRLLDLIDETVVKANPKIFIGYSDLTALHHYLYRKFDWVTFHGPMVAKDFAAGPEHYDLPSLLGVLTKAAAFGQITSTKTEWLHRGNGEQVSGRLLGGCLSIVSALVGTPYELDTRGALLFLEDTATKPFVIDRMLTQLRLSGKLNEVKAIVFGEMIDCVQHQDQGYRIQDVLADCTAALKVPVLFGLPSGHSPRGNLTLPLGIKATLDIESSALRIDEAAVC